MSSEIRDAILRIVKSDPDIGNAIAKAINPSKIKARRGIAYISSDGSIATKGGADPDGDGAGAPGAGQETDPENANTADTVNAPGSITGGAAGTPAGDTGDVDDLFGASGTHTAIGSQVAVITGKDPATSGSVSLYLNRECGAEYDAPSGWDDPDTPPTDSSWEQGYFWVADIVGYPGYGYFYQPGLVQVRLDAKAVWEAQHPDFVEDYDEELPDNELRVYGHNSVDTDPGDVTYYIRAAKKNCAQMGSTGAPATVCEPTEAPELESEHPSDGTCKIAYDCSEGGFKGHDLDPDCSAAEKTPEQCKVIDADNGSGEHYRACRLGNGNTLVTPVDGSNTPLPSRITTELDADGKVVGAYGTTALLDIYSANGL